MTDSPLSSRTGRAPRPTAGVRDVVAGSARGARAGRVLGAWPAPAEHWRSRRTSLRGAVAGAVGLTASVACALLCLDALAPSLRPLRSVPPVALSLAVIGAAMAVGGARGLWTRDRAAVVLRAGGPSRAPPAGDDGEVRGLLDRTVGLWWWFAWVLTGTVGVEVFEAFRVPTTEATVAGFAAASLSVASVGFVRLLCQGGVEVRWRSATLVPGGRAKLLVGTPPGGSRLVGAEFVLRCVGPHPRRLPVTGASGIVWAQSVVAVPRQAPGPDDFVEVTFDLPADAPVSRLDADPPTYWELIVRGRSLWGVVTESFLVPVRAVPSDVGPAEELPVDGRNSPTER